MYCIRASRHSLSIVTRDLAAAVLCDCLSTLISSGSFCRCLPPSPPSLPLSDFYLSLQLYLSHSITSPHTHTHTHTRSLTSSDHRRAVRPKLRQKASSAHLRLLRDREDVTTEMLTPSSDNSGLDSNSFSTYMSNGICLWEAVVARDSSSKRQ